MRMYLLYVYSIGNRALALFFRPKIFCCGS